MIDDEQDEKDAWRQGWDEGYEEGHTQGFYDCLQAVTREYLRMFQLDRPQQARFEWVLKRVREEAGLTP